MIYIIFVLLKHFTMQIDMLLALSFETTGHFIYKLIPTFIKCIQLQPKKQTKGKNLHFITMFKMR